MQQKLLSTMYFEANSSMILFLRTSPDGKAHFVKRNTVKLNGIPPFTA